MSDIGLKTRYSRQIARSGSFLAVVGFLIGWASIVVAWEVISVLSDNFPDLIAVANSFLELTRTGDAADALSTTLIRLSIGFALGWGLGVVVGMLIGFIHTFELTLKPILVTALAIPSPVTVIAFTLLVGIDNKALILALAFSVFPFACVSMLAAVASLDTKLLEMSQAYRFNTIQRIVHVYIGQLVLEIISTARTNFAMAWKFLIAIEAVATSTGVGAEMLFSFHALEPERMAALALLFTILMVILESQLFRRLERICGRWRIT